MIHILYIFSGSSSQIETVEIQGSFNNTDSSNHQLEDLIDNIIESESIDESQNEITNGPSEDSGSENVSDNDILLPTIPSTGPAASEFVSESEILHSTVGSTVTDTIITSANQESLQSDEDTSATVIMDGFIIEKPEKEEEDGSFVISF